MRNLLSSQQQRILLDFLKTNPLLVFDYDGTLVPIVKDAAQARLRMRTRRLLGELCERVPCAVLSGRARRDVLSQLGSLPLAHVWGNHGAESGDAHQSIRPMLKKVAHWKRLMQKSVGHLQGVRIEDKKYSLSIHYRGARRGKFTLQKIEQALAALHGHRVIGGKKVVNILPIEVGGKGRALLQLKKFHGKKTAFYVGDDLNDEEVFELSSRERVFKVRVGISDRSAADYYLASQRNVDVLLELLLKAARRRTIS